MGLNLEGSESFLHSRNNSHLLLKRNLCVVVSFMLFSLIVGRVGGFLALLSDEKEEAAYITKI